MNYKDTLNLPKTDFSMQAKLVELEPRMLKLWAQRNSYNLLRERSKGWPKFILHDGPPYANGDIHLGHALNKILKDFVVKYKNMQGFDVPFVPGWDCHGLPVEHQLFKELGISKHEMDKLEFRKKAKEFALKFVDIQREQFQKLGLLADWQRPYLTLDFAYEAEIIRVFAKLVKAGYVYHGQKPISWCISCETALAEAEVEYEDHRSPSIYVKFKRLDAKDTFFLIWTTTPWTLVSNVAISVHPKFNYSLVEVSQPDKEKEIWILAADLVDTVMQKIGIENYNIISEIRGAELENLKARHPFLERNSQLVLADYVSNQEGTGCVHTAPGHGQEDYLTGLRYKLPMIMPVDEQGKFDQSCAEFSGSKVFQANDAIISKCKENGSLIHAETMQHSYPHCWRCKQPLITRSTRQWFIDVGHNSLRKKALQAIKKVRWFPQSGEKRISSMVETRPDWCLSRQRFWGVPIPVVFCKDCGKEILQAEIIEKVAEQVLQFGSDVWFSKSVDQLLGEKIHCPACKKNQLAKEEDIIDVWFESGVSHQAVLGQREQLEFPASLYLEGSDQHRGWFQTSLLTSIPVAGSAPYQQVLTHGFVVDGEGKKMSKSRGNVISPQEITCKYGAEVLRLWVAGCDYTDDVRISPQILTSTAEAYRKIRNTLRFLIGNLYDFTLDKGLTYNQLDEIDKWALSSLSILLSNVTQEFERYNYLKAFRQLYNFCVQEMSSFYLDVLKDRLYTFGKDSPSRRSAQTAIREILISLTKMIAPILSFTAEELWQNLAQGHLGKTDPDLVLLASWPKTKREWINPKLDEKFSRLIKLRNAVLKAIENEREKGLVRSSLEAKVELHVSDNELFKFLQKNQNLLITVFIVSSVSLEKVADFAEDMFRHPEVPGLGIKVLKIDSPKCQRCWNYRTSVGENTEYPQLCQRCVEVMQKLTEE
ncbi:MAG: isoleucine--tRNA ligase [Candidatus Omnitrophica bacterium]|nr:isoleucine--tRNA ligase [Candidatus Omnitrophota bacterium]